MSRQRIDKSQAIIHLIEQGITGAKRQRYNDLLAEINEYYIGHDDLRQVERQGIATPERLNPTLELPAPEMMQPNDQIDTTDHLPSPLPEAQRLPEEPQIPTEIPDPVHVEYPETMTSDSTPRTSPARPIRDTASAQQGQAEEAAERRRPIRQAALKPAGFYAKLNKGESAADYTACHLRAKSYTEKRPPSRPDFQK